MTRDELYRAVATAEAIRQGYSETLGQQELAGYIRTRGEDVNLRGHVDTALTTLAALGDAMAERLLIRGEVSKP